MHSMVCDSIIGVSFGFGLAKADLFPQAAARGAGQIILVCSPIHCSSFDVSYDIC
jgi:hypothetical protein